MPVRHLFAQGLPLVLVELVDGLEQGRALRHEGALLEQREDVVRQRVGPLVRRHLLEELRLGDAPERVLDLALEVLGQLGNALLAAVAGVVVVLDAVFVDTAWRCVRV
ncbi:hypothetical protein CTA1_1312 [Colletotrichum tanaceti]|uniref:Secreted protein n=1 Tax=Colletotrichum tanaceti TaxID=1306861 RepID=A0A4U6X7P1_9PEZI|nr:hypothetical protein CTA1_1312 [Colletotrichum tanaceti]